MSGTGQESAGAYELSDTERRVLNEIQWSFPLCDRPFLSLSERIGIPEDEVMSIIVTLKEAQIIRQINAIFDTRRLGYHSTLVSFSVPEESIDLVAENLNRHPGVSHNYRREGRFNLWFTLATPPDVDVEVEASRLAHENKVEQWHLLPALKLYKIGVKLNMTGEERKEEIRERKWSVPFIPDEKDKRFIRALQKDLAITERPFDAISLEAGVTNDELFQRCAYYQELGVMRRFAAILRHQNAGFVANGMVCWRADETTSARIASAAREYSEVSHCYMRPVYGDWPYSTYTMIHGRRREECERIAREISAKSGVTDFVVLYSTKEYKKQRVEYFV